MLVKHSSDDLFVHDSSEKEIRKIIQNEARNVQQPEVIIVIARSGSERLV